MQLAFSDTDGSGRPSTTSPRGKLQLAPRGGFVVPCAFSGGRWLPVLSPKPSLRGAKRRSNPFFLLRSKLDCFASLAMTWKHAFSISRRVSPELCYLVVPLCEKEGAGNAGCALHPRSRVQKLHIWRTRAYRAAGTLRHPLRNGFTAYFVLSPVNGLVATVACGNLPQAWRQHRGARTTRLDRTLGVFVRRLSTILSEQCCHA
jgi:hypothetical protein